MTDPVLLYAASAALACVLLLGALEKLKDMAAFAAAVQAYEIVPAAFGGLFAWGYVLAEALAGALLLVPGLRSPGAALALLVLALATAGVAVNLARGRRDIDCGCGGPAMRGAAQRLAGVVDAAGFRRGAGRVAQPAVGRRRLGVRPGDERRGPLLHRQSPAGLAPEAAAAAHLGTTERHDMEALIISNFLLWGVVLCLLLVILALSRQIGVLYERVAPMGALTMDKGPAVGEAAPRFELADLLGRRLTIGERGQHSQLLFFLSPTCPVCKKLLPILKSVASTENAWLRIVLASDGEMPEHLAFYRQAGLERFPYLLSTELGMKFQISKLPYAVLIDESGVIRAKGLINSREQLESLFTAKELGVASVQEFLAGGALQETRVSRKENGNALAG